MTKRIPYSPLRPDFVALERSLWALNASRYATTMRGNTVHLADQGVGYIAEQKRVQEQMAKFSERDLQDFLAYTSFVYKKRQAVAA